MMSLFKSIQNLYISSQNPVSYQLLEGFSMQYKIVKLFIACFILFMTNLCFSANTDIDSSLIAVMKAWHVPVVGYAIIKNGKILRINTISIDPKLPASNNSLFQSASISKSVTAYGALKLVS